MKFQCRRFGSVAVSLKDDHHWSQANHPVKKEKGLAFSCHHCFLSVALCILFFHGSLQAQAPFSKGVNLTGWFQSSSPNQIQFSKFAKKDFERIKSLGCDVIRLPINLHAMTDGSPDYVLNPLFLSFLDQAVDWAEELQLHMILDNHTFDPAAATDPQIGPVLVKVWTQMAAHYKNRSSFVYYEVLNEPHGISDGAWGTIQQSVITAIRTVDTTHFIVVGGANWNSYNSLTNLPIYSDTKLIYTFHFYNPFIFTHQGASWTDPSLVPLGGVPFPYRSSDMPVVPPSLKGTWLESAVNNYPLDGTETKVKSLIDIAVNFKNGRNVPVFCGEFGVFIPNSNNNDRVKWYELVRQHFAQVTIPWTIWDYTGGFGLFEKESNELFDSDLNVPLLEALGLNVPPQKEYRKIPKTNGFLLYDDFIGEGIIESSFPGAGTLNYYSGATPQVGVNCIHWTDVTQYNAIGLDFKPDIDLSLLKSHGHVLEFWARGNSPAARFDIRFIDTKVNADDHPWRMGKTIDNSIAPWDGQWHKITLSLDEMEEKGSYDNAWYPPEGKFEWWNVDKFEIVAEFHHLNDIDFWFDDIRISGEEVPYDETVVGVSGEWGDVNFMVYPNPATNHAGVQFSLVRSGHVKLRVFNLNGQGVATLTDQAFSAGSHQVECNMMNHLPPGMYLIELQTQDQVVIKKLVKGQ